MFANGRKSVLHRKRECIRKRQFKEAVMRISAAAFVRPICMGIFIIFAAVLLLASNGNTGKSPAAGHTGASRDKQNMDSADLVTPAHGPSWIKRIGIFDIRATAMGEMGGYDPPPPSPRKEPEFPVETGRYGNPAGMGMGGMMGRSYSNYRLSPAESERLLGERFFLAGSDLYRLDCRSCHGPNGDGAPPEINSLIGPFQGTSPALLEKRMKKLGRPIGTKLAKDLAAQAEGNIRQRLQNGGKKMPPFRHLDREEVNALLKYLKAHVGAPESQGKEMLVKQSVSRVGEHLVKGTCQICHDATGPGIGRMGMMRGIIPSLASFPWEQSMQSIVWQVELGSRRMMMGGQRMPAYPYITAEESAAAYLYLLQYPPYY
jgi:mono/diheme cytochrome c family protein